MPKYPADLSEVVDRINDAFKTSDILAICRAIGDEAQLHGVADIARTTGLEQPSIYRAFGGEQFPNFSTVLKVLGAMGLRLKVTRGQKNPLAGEEGAPVLGFCYGFVGVVIGAPLAFAINITRNWR
jgi:probable addiction module antidote protein